jgi:hypothetical protein
LLRLLAAASFFRVIALLLMVVRLVVTLAKLVVKIITWPFRMLLGRR